MQEHEYIYEHEHNQKPDPVQASGAGGSLSSQEREVCTEQVHKGAIGEELNEVEELLVEMRARRARRRLGRILIGGLLLSFLACLGALWLSGTLLSAPDQLFPIFFLQVLAAHRIPVLCAPVLLLIVCYASLRSLTSEIMAVPERYLDERQKMLRDQAHRSAFKIVKFSSLLVPVAFLLPHLPWFNALTPASAPTTFITIGTMRIFDAHGGVVYGLSNPTPGMEHWQAVQLLFADSMSVQPGQLIQPTSTLEIALAGGLLLLVLLLIISALPMVVLAWKGKA